MILKLKLKNIDDNYAWHFIDGVENVAVEKSELGNVKGITYKKKGDPDVTNLVLYKESRGFLAAEAYILNDEGKTIENLNSSSVISKNSSRKYFKVYKAYNEEVIVNNRNAEEDTVAELARISEEKNMPVVCFYEQIAKHYQEKYPKAQFISFAKFTERGRRFGDVILFGIEDMIDALFGLLPNTAKARVITHTVEQ